jgi:hypothetical protein
LRGGKSTNTRYQPINELPTVEAETAWKAIAKLTSVGKLLAAGAQFRVRIVLENDGTTAQAINVPLTPEFEVPLDWQPADGWE